MSSGEGVGKAHKRHQGLRYSRFTNPSKMTTAAMKACAPHRPTYSSTTLSGCFESSHLHQTAGLNQWACLG